MKRATIATHNGSEVHQAHNRREERVVEKQKHIDSNGVHENWIDDDIRQAYNEIFDTAVKTYNAKQKKNPNRKIDDYYNKIAKDSKKHVAYEMILGVYEQEGSEPIPEAECRQILSEYLRDFMARNGGNLVVVGAYYHADEEGKPHMHLDYIPVARDLKRGMSVQNSLSQALKQLGYETETQHNTRQMQFQRAENASLERICNEHGIGVEHPLKEKREHLDTETYKAVQHLTDLGDELGSLQETLEILNGVDDKGVFGKSLVSRNDVMKLQDSVKKLTDALAESTKEVKRKDRRIQELMRGYNDLCKEVEELKERINDLASQLTRSEYETDKDCEVICKNLALLAKSDPLRRELIERMKWPHSITMGYENRMAFYDKQQMRAAKVKNRGKGKSGRGDDFGDR